MSQIKKKKIYKQTNKVLFEESPPVNGHHVTMDHGQGGVIMVKIGHTEIKI